tara:strand:+ start:34 stop:597 length:564 start_codon:yes stop_codon:yes gene_type:complete
MKKILMPLMAATMLVPSVTLASSIRPGSRVTHDSLNSGSRSKTLCLNEKEKFAEKCEVTIDETGVKGPAGHITNVVQWIKEEKEFSYGGAVAGGVAGAGVGMAAGLGSCMIVGPLCLFTAPAIMTSGATGGAGLGGKGTGKYFTVIGDDAEGNRLIQEFYVTSGKAVRKTSRDLLLTTELAEGEVKG